MLSELLKLELIMTLLILVGGVMRYRGKITDAGRECLTNVLIDAILPCNIIVSFMGQGGIETLMKSLPVVALSLVVIVMSVLVGNLLFRRFRPESRVLARYGMISSNSVFIGLPVVQSLFGDYGALLQSLYMIFIRSFMWSYGMSLFTGKSGDLKETIRRTLKHPCVIAVEIGILIMLFDIPVPGVISRTMNYFNVCMMGMSMLLIGSILFGMSLENLFRPDVWWFNFTRLILAPAVTLLICVLLKTDYYITAVVVLMTAMPCGSLAAVMAAKYDADVQYGSLIVATSTIVGTVTIPIWFLIIQKVYGM